MGIIGACLGDIAGSRFEFSMMGPMRKLHNYELFSDVNFFTDDTVLSIACKEAIDKWRMNPIKQFFCKPNFRKYYLKWVQKYPSVGYGSSFETWALSGGKTPYNSFGNGSAMRCSYIGQIAKSLKECQKLAKWSAEVTHNHPEGIKGAKVLASCVFMARKGCSKEDILKYGIEQYPLYKGNLEYIPKHGEYDGKYFYGPEKPSWEYKDEIEYFISCQGSVPVAIRCFYDTNSFEECMYLINSMNIDTDTVGAIAGAICESFYGKIDRQDQLLKKYLPDEILKVLRVKK